MVGNNIKKYLLENGIKFSVVAEKAEIPIQTFSAMINEKRKIIVDEYADICKVLGVELSKFI